MTGATGSLGSFLLEQLSNLPSDIVERVVCLVRADNDHEGRLRVERVVGGRGIEIHRDKVRVYSAELSAPQLGLTSEVYAELAEKVDVIIHVSHHRRRARTSHLIASRPHGRYTLPVVLSPLKAVSRVSLTSCRSHHQKHLCYSGTRNLLNMLAAASPESRLYFCSSLASVLAKPPSDGRILEAPSLDPSTASPIGYSQSKWVTEAICRSASESPVLHDRVHVLRIGQLCGDTLTGHWNEKEGWPLLIRTGQTTGCLPLLNAVRFDSPARRRADDADPAQTPSWLPVDLAANAMWVNYLPSRTCSTDIAVPVSTLFWGTTAPPSYITSYIHSASIGAPS